MLERAAGIESATYSLGSCRSTAELRPQRAEEPLPSPDIYAEQYLVSGIYFWLLSWRVLSRRGLGTDTRALVALAAVSCLFTALLEAGWLWARHGYGPVATLNLNFAPIEDLSPASKVLVLGLLAAFTAGVTLNGTKKTRILRARTIPLVRVRLRPRSVFGSSRRSKNY